MLLASRNRRVVGEYRHSPWLTVSGAIVALAMAGLGLWTLMTEMPKLMRL
jgi:Mn2+/Fe2+ NRAMP family transporter